MLSLIEDCDKMTRRTYEHIIHTAPAKTRAAYKDKKNKQ